VQAGVLDVEPVRSFVLGLVEKKMNLPPDQLFWRAVLANWLVCLGVWMAVRTKEETARILMIWWCMFTFITCGFEHSIANMCGLLLGLLVPNPDTITWAVFGYNLGLATLGNEDGRAHYFDDLYWIGCP